jgi:oligopeptide transport system substrate-binding protein
MKRFRARLHYRWRVFIAGFLLLCLTLLVPGCFSGDQDSLYYGRVTVPRQQEFRWADGGLPQVFDPAFAAAPPDTDAVRALFEGLTDYDPRTLAPTPGVAERWESSEEGRVWTFYLRDDARWSTGESVTAADFVRSWERTLRLGDLAPHTELLSNIVGARAKVGAARNAVQTPAAATPSVRNSEAARDTVAPGSDERPFGAQEISARVLRVRLHRPNLNFPALVAHPVFRPVKVTGQDGDKKIGARHLISNGAFLLANSGSDKVLLQRAETYWDKAAVNLERVEFVKTLDTETALDAYHAGEIDAVTNAPLEPLALKLLAPFADYRRNTFAALTYYSFNTSRAPFNDVRVREALAISIDRERISEEQMGGATEPAATFLPVLKTASVNEAVVAKSATLNKDHDRAKQLLAEAGYPEGKGFPVIRLLINRNEQQRQVAQAVATMWRSVLKIETDIEARNWDEYETAIRDGNYDLVRRGAVMQSADEASNIRMLFASAEKAVAQEPESVAAATPLANQGGKGTAGGNSQSLGNTPLVPIETEAEALRQVTAIPIYFASSYALVKPYVSGFESNMLDAPSLKNVKIDTAWQEPKTTSLFKK